MDKLVFLQVQKENEDHYRLLMCLMLPYMAELDAHQPDRPPTLAGTIERYTRSTIAMQGPGDRYLELCFKDGAVIGFFHAKIDREGHMGFIKPGFGCVLEFYVTPAYRRCGVGKAMLKRIESLFLEHGAGRIWLTADPVSGEPFWEAMGFAHSGEISPENQMKVFEKGI